MLWQTKLLFCRHKKWYASLENRHKDSDTPVKKLIRMMPDVAMMVFNKCTDDSFNNEHTTSDHWDYQVGNWEGCVISPIYQNLSNTHKSQVSQHNPNRLSLITDT